MGSINLGTVRITLKPAWTTTSGPYKILNAVPYNGSTYIAKRDVPVGHEPGMDGDIYWMLMAAKGDKGDQGDQGIQGIQGIQGVKGDTGDQGIQGIQGCSLLSGSGAPSNAFGVDYDTYLNEDTGAVYSKSGGVWTQTGSVQGPQGERGPQGFQGEKGDKGDTGDQGIQGDAAPNMQLQYSSDSNSWHNDALVTDQYVRFSTDGGTTWGGALSVASGVLWYGIEWDVTNSSPECTRIGNMDLHRALPIQNAMYTCLLQDDLTESYKLDRTDHTKKADGTAADLTGADGQVMVWVPEYYLLFEAYGSTRALKFSDLPLPGFKKMGGYYIASFKASLYRPENKLSSVVNTTADYRGGNNNSAWDAETRTLLGKPVTQISRTAARTAAQNRGPNWWLEPLGKWEARTLLVFLQFATRYSQDAINTAKDSSGFCQGGLGTGVTNIDGTAWNNWNSYYPFINCGSTLSIGDGYGEVAYEMPAEYGTLTTYSNRWRGIEDPFGDIWENLDGVLVRIFADSEATPVSEVWATDDPALFNDTDITGFEKIGEVPRANGYIQEMIPGHLLPVDTTGAGSTTYWADYFYTSLPSSGSSLRTVHVGGAAGNGSLAGLVSSHTYYTPSYSYASLGARLCAIPPA